MPRFAVPIKKLKWKIKQLDERMDWLTWALQIVGEELRRLEKLEKAATEGHNRALAARFAAEAEEPRQVHDWLSQRFQQANFERQSAAAKLEVYKEMRDHPAKKQTAEKGQKAP